MSAPPSEAMSASPQNMAKVYAWLCEEQKRRPLTQSERKLILKFQGTDLDANRRTTASKPADDPTPTEVSEALRALGGIQGGAGLLDGAISAGGLDHLTPAQTAVLNKVAAKYRGWEDMGPPSFFDPRFFAQADAEHDTGAASSAPTAAAMANSAATTDASELELDLSGDEASLKARIHQLCQDQRRLLKEAVDAHLEARLLFDRYLELRSERGKATSSVLIPGLS